MKNKTLFWSGFFLIAAVLIQSFAALAKFYWIFELFTHYVVYYVCIALGFTLFHAIKKHRKHALAWTVLLLLNLTTIAPYLVTPRPTASDTEPTLTLLTQNVYYENTDTTEFYDLVTTLQPDVFIINEANAIWGTTQSQVLNGYPYTALTQKAGVHGIFMGSKIPGLFTEIPLGEHVGLEFIPEDRNYRVLGVHPQAPMTPSWAAERNAQFRDITNYANSSELPTVIIGDFNATPWSPHFKDLLSQTGLRDARLGFGLVPTWKAGSLFFHLPIDHALVSPDFEVLNFESFPTKISDHLGILVSLKRHVD